MKFSKIVTCMPLLAVLSQALVIPTDASALQAFRESAEQAPFDKGFDIAPLMTSPTAAQQAIEDSYIIVFKDHVDEKLAAKHHLWVNTVHEEAMKHMKRDGSGGFLNDGIAPGLKDVFAIGEKFKGYAGRFTKDTVEAIRRHEAVAFVEKDSRVFASEFETQNGAPWGLARVSHRNPLSLGSFNKYLFNDDGGEGVTAYVIDTGTNIDHEDFEGRAHWGKTVPEGDFDADDNGHGTHCSGTIAGKTYGVAKKANVVAVKVLRSNGSGTMSDVIKGVEFAAESHIKDSKSKKNYKGATANMSLGGGKSPALDIAVNAAVKAGLHFAVAAGNDNADACDYSPAAAENAVTVGASSIGDARAYFSNYGKCVDIFGPGVNILSTYIGSPRAVATLSGTSMASPHICGLLTYFLSLQPDSDSEFATSGPISPAQLKKNLISFGTEGILSDIDQDTPNILAFNGGHENLTDFWHNEQVHEDTVRILPIEEKIKADLQNVGHEIENIFEDIRAGLGLGF
ncbi:subtilisin-like protease 3 [Trichomonascus vanleenenianus]|uniref:S8 family peptidase n=1 Tax=Trichomonascus vanleenenianus TaxID=2268995 RepID=UPI003ECB9913